jgi:predicted membrane channel-forming protein YqfA (hemolysin III family)
MRFLFFFVVLIVLALWAAFFSRPANRRLSNTLYIIAGVLSLLFLIGYLRLDGYF